MALSRCDEQQTARSARVIAPKLRAPMRVYLRGDLGAGKTFWARAALRALGVTGAVVSPSYLVAQSYVAGGLTVHHLDCYRLQGREVGDEARELLDDDEAVKLVEWPDNAARLPPPDATVYFEEDGGADEALRRLTFVSHSRRGESLLEGLR